MNVEMDWGRAIPFLGIHKWDIRCSAPSALFVLKWSAGMRQEKSELLSFKIKVLWIRKLYLLSALSGNWMG